MAISIYGYDKQGNFFSVNPHKARIKRLQKKLDHFFKVTQNNTLYANTVKSKGRYYPVMVTVTYPSNKEWDKRDISKLIDSYRKHWIQTMKQPREAFRYVWVAELQKRGVIHYHLLLWCKRGHSMPKPDRYFKKGHTKIEGIRRGVWKYLGKYLSKGSEGGFPKGARIFGTGGLSKAERTQISYECLPKYVKEYFMEADGTVRRVKGGFEQNNVFLKSPWSVYRGELNGERIICMEYAETWCLIDNKEVYSDGRR